MQIQINTDRNIDGHDALAQWVTASIESALTRVSEHITRVEVHLSDENGGQKEGPHEKRCLMEARLEGRQPIAVDHQAASLGEAVDGAADKLGRLIDSTLGKQRDQQRRSLPLPPQGQGLATGPEVPKHG
jgi:ribosome-associated translation inhibitor RaiA